MSKAKLQKARFMITYILLEKLHLSFLIILWVLICAKVLTPCGPFDLWGGWDVDDIVIKTWIFFGACVCMIFSLCSKFFFFSSLNVFGTSMLVGYFFKITSSSPLKSQMVYFICFYILGRHRAYWCWWTCWAQRNIGRFLKCFPSEVEWLISCEVSCYVWFLSQIKLYRWQTSQDQQLLFRQGTCSAPFQTLLFLQTVWIQCLNFLAGTCKLDSCVCLLQFGTNRIQKVYLTAKLDPACSFIQILVILRIFSIRLFSDWIMRYIYSGPILYTDINKAVDESWSSLLVEINWSAWTCSPMQKLNNVAEICDEIYARKVL